MKMNDRVTKLEAIIPSIDEKLGKLDTKLDGLDHIIRGNGAPGLAAKVDVLTSRQRRFRDVVYTVVGGVIVGITVSIFSSWSVRHVKQQISSMPEVQQKP